MRGGRGRGGKRCARFPATAGTLPQRRRGGGQTGPRRWGGRVGEEIVGPWHRKAEGLRCSRVSRGPSVWVARGDPALVPSCRPADWLPPSWPRLPHLWPSRPGPVSSRYRRLVGAASRGLGDRQVAGPALPQGALPPPPRSPSRLEGLSPTRHQPKGGPSSRTWPSVAGCPLYIFLAGKGCVLYPEPISLVVS